MYAMRQECRHSVEVSGTYGAQCWGTPGQRRAQQCEGGGDESHSLTSSARSSDRWRDGEVEGLGGFLRLTTSSKCRRLLDGRSAALGTG